MNLILKSRTAVGAVETVEKPSVLGEAFPNSLWESGLFADFHSCGRFHSASRPIEVIFAGRGHDAQTESLDSRETVRDCAGNVEGQGADRAARQKASGFRCVAAQMAGAVFRGWEGRNELREWCVCG